MAIFLLVNSKCDLDLGVIDIILSHDTSSNDCEQMYQVFLKSHNKWHSNGPDKIIYGHFWPLNSQCELDVADIDVILLRDTPSNNGEQMCQMILKSHKEWHSYGPEKLIYGHFLTYELKVWPWPWRYRRNSFARHTVQWWWTHVPNDFNISQ